MVRTKDINPGNIGYVEIPFFPPFLLTLGNLQHIDNGVRDQLEHYNSKHSSSTMVNLYQEYSTPIQSVNRIVTKREHPEPLRPFLPEIDAFARHNHHHVLHPILR